MEVKIKRYPYGSVCEGQSVIFICQSTGGIIKFNYSWAKNGVLLSNSSFIVLENVTQADNGNYTCRIEDKQIYITQIEQLKFDPSTCRADLAQTRGKYIQRVCIFGLEFVLFCFVFLFVCVFYYTLEIMSLCGYTKNHLYTHTINLKYIFVKTSTNMDFDIN